MFFKKNQAGNNGASIEPEEGVTERYQSVQAVGLREGLSVGAGRGFQEAPGLGILGA